MIAFRSIRTKLLAAFAGAGLFVLLTFLVALEGTSVIENDADRAAADVTRSLVALHHVARTWAQAASGTRTAVAAALAERESLVQAQRAARSRALAEIDQARREFEALGPEVEERSAWSEVLSGIAAWRATDDVIWKALEAGDARSALELALGKSTAVYLGGMKPLNDLVDRQMAEADQARAGAHAAAASISRRLWGLLILGVAASIGLGALIRVRCLRPLDVMTRTMERLAVGDLEQQVEHRSKDEIGKLADAVRGTIDYLKGLSRGAEALSKGDVTTVVTPRSAEDLLSRNFVWAVEALTAMVDDMSSLIKAAQEGDLSKRVEVSRFHGAYGELMRGANGMMEAFSAPLQEALRVLDRIASKDLTARAQGEFRGEYALVMSAVNEAAENLQASLEQVASAAEQVASASGQIAKSSQSVAQGASEQASALTETSASLGEIADSTRRNAQSAKEADALAATAKEASDSGSLAMSEMSQAMSRIRQSAEGTAAIIRDINEIAFQTNLLALNAAVEAARAGEAGRGFAVVAEEVRNLAMRSKEAARKTESLISESMQMTQQGERISSQVGSSLQAIVEAVGKVTEIVGAISALSEQQARGVEQVTQAAAQMDHVTQRAAANSEETSSAAVELNAQAQEMTTLVGEFVIGGGAHPGRRARAMNGAASHAAGAEAGHEPI